MIDIILETLALITVTVLIVCVVYTGFSRNYTNTGWHWILAGLGFIFIGALFDLTDNFPSLNYLVVVGDTPAQAVITKLVGASLAYGFLCIGLIQWLPTLASVDRVVKAFNRVAESEDALSKANRKLDMQHKELQSILRNSPDVIFRVDTAGRIAFISDAIRNYGYDPKTLVGSDLVLLVHPEDQDKIKNDFETPFDDEAHTARLYTVRIIVRKRPEDKDGEVYSGTVTRTFLISIDDIVVGDDGAGGDALRQGIARDMSELNDMRETVHTLQAMVPMCACCKSVRNDGGYWERVEEYIAAQVEAPLSHSICPKCLKENYGDIGERSSKTG